MEKKISIVTPVYNGEQYIERNICSIINQNYSNYEHIIVDGGSSDKTLEIAKRYGAQYPQIIISEKDDGMYDAITKGFSVASGEIFAWLNADDSYMSWAFQIMNAVIQKNVQWCTAIASCQNKNNIYFEVGYPYFFRRKWIKKGYYNSRVLKFIQQESTFWTRELWKKACSNQSIANYKLAGDYQLWKLFAKYEELYTVSTIIGGFRMHEGQKSEDIESYLKECECLNLSIIQKKLIHLQNRYYQYKKKNLIQLSRELD